MARESTYFGTAIISFAVIAAAVLGIASAVDAMLGGKSVADMSPAAVAERIAPVAKLNTGEPIQAAAPAEPAPAASATGTRSGEAVYNSACLACHATGAAGAPKLGDTAAWAPRIEKGIDALMNSALNGLNAMPPRGTCGSCSDDELKNAIEFMVSQSQ